MHLYSSGPYLLVDLTYKTPFFLCYTHIVYALLVAIVSYSKPYITCVTMLMPPSAKKKKQHIIFINFYVQNFCS